MSADQILHYTRLWAYEHDYRSADVYPVIRGGAIVLFYVRDVGFRQP
jgi:hypothetical protein